MAYSTVTVLHYVTEVFRPNCLASSCLSSSYSCCITGLVPPYCDRVILSHHSLSAHCVSPTCLWNLELVVFLEKANIGPSSPLFDDSLWPARERLSIFLCQICTNNSQNYTKIIQNYYVVIVFQRDCSYTFNEDVASRWKCNKYSLKTNN